MLFVCACVCACVCLCKHTQEEFVLEEESGTIQGDFPLLMLRLIMGTGMYICIHIFHDSIFTYIYTCTCTFTLLPSRCSCFASLVALICIYIYIYIYIYLLRAYKFSQMYTCTHTFPILIFLLPMLCLMTGSGMYIRMKICHGYTYLHRCVQAYHSHFSLCMLGLIISSSVCMCLCLVMLRLVSGSGMYTCINIYHVYMYLHICVYVHLHASFSCPAAHVPRHHLL